MTEINKRGKFYTDPQEIHICTLHNNDTEVKVLNIFKKIYGKMNCFTRELGKENADIP